MASEGAHPVAEFHRPIYAAIEAQNWEKVFIHDVGFKVGLSVKLLQLPRPFAATAQKLPCVTLQSRLMAQDGGDAFKETLFVADFAVRKLFDGAPKREH
jgi:hypothetical protein